MTTFDKQRKQLIAELKDQEYRDAYVSSSVDVGIAFQIRALRKQASRNWSQEDLANQTGMKQERISALENPSNTPNIKTLKRLASAFDVGLVVRFVPFSELVNWEINLSPESLEVLSFEEETYFQDIEEEQIKDNFIIDEEDQIPDSVGTVRPQELRDVSVGYNYKGDEISDDTNKIQVQIL